MQHKAALLMVMSLAVSWPARSEEWWQNTEAKKRAAEAADKQASGSSAEYQGGVDATSAVAIAAGGIFLWWLHNKMTDRPRRVEKTFRVVNVDFNDHLNIRSAPNLRAQKIGAIPSNGRGIEIADCVYTPGHGRWCVARHGEQQGWIAADNIRPE